MTKSVGRKTLCHIFKETQAANYMKCLVILEYLQKRNIRPDRADAQPQNTQHNR